MLLEAAQDLFFTEGLDGVVPGCRSEAGTEDGIGDEATGGGVQRSRDSGSIGGGDDQATARDDMGDLSARVGSSKDGAAARKHSRQLRGHDQIGRATPLQKQMDVGSVEQVIEEF